jgi:hypothetical protein
MRGLYFYLGMLCWGGDDSEARGGEERGARAEEGLKGCGRAEEREHEPMVIGRRRASGHRWDSHCFRFTCFSGLTKAVRVRSSESCESALGGVGVAVAERRRRGSCRCGKFRYEKLRSCGGKFEAGGEAARTKKLLY